MKAGRELDALVAEKVMGWKWTKFKAWPFDSRMVRRPYPGDSIMLRLSDRADGTEELAVGWDTELPHFSTDIAAAWEIAERMLGNYGYYFHLEYDSVQWCVTLVHADTRQEIKTSDIRASRAIASAALLAVGVSEETLEYDHWSVD